MQSKCVWLFSTNLAHIITNLKQSLDNITGVRVTEGDTAACMVSISEIESGVAQSSPTLCDPVDCSLPGSSVQGILQARILDWVAISFSRDLPDPGIEPGSPALQADALPSEPPGKQFQQKSKLVGRIVLPALHIIHW